ncbi:MAG TPA: hypothetical protein VGR91_08020, partial [Stellaceae bacterium]|nr:hypothetical protein [Stellaceae bacterium]
KAIVRFRMPGGETMEILAGRVGESPTGDLVLFTLAERRDLAGSVVIRPHSAPGGFSERYQRFQPRSDRIAYAPAREDPGEILGVVEYATVPEKPP